MRDDCFPSFPNQVRRLDDNSLLRLLDRARQVIVTTDRSLERQRAERALRSIARELKARGLPAN
jgi:hypothetical protein